VIIIPITIGSLKFSVASSTENRIHESGIY